MTIPAPDGCPWPIDPACLDTAWAEFDDDTKDRAVALASNTLRRLCAFRVGGCPVTVRPCDSGCLSSYSYSVGYVNGYPYTGAPFVPFNWNGSISNVCVCSGPCRHSTGVRLDAPVYSISEVKVDGTVVPDTNYWLSDNWLIPLGSQTFPRTQNLDLPDTQPGTFSVTYYDSAPVDGLGAYAAGKLAMQYALACTPGGKCKLPEQVTNVVRQGVTYSIPAGAFPNGETGLREVDAFIALWNPNHRTQRTRVWSP